MQGCTMKTARAYTGGVRPAVVNSTLATSFQRTISVVFCAP